MSLEALAERTWKTQRILVIPLLVLGAMVFIGGLVSNFPLLTGVGVALASGGGFAIWSLRSKAAGFQALLDDPKRVAQVVPVVQNVQGIVTHYPVVVVADDGKAYRIATWAKSVPEALAPFLARFPHARGLESDSVFAPDDGFGARFKMVGFMFASMAVGFVFVGVMALPKTFSHLSSSNAAYETQVKRNRTEAEALAAVGKVELEQSWSKCSVDSLEPAISVLLDGAKSQSWSSKRDGFLSNEFPLKVSTATDRDVYRRDFVSVFFDALSGSKLVSRPMERGYGVVGVRVGDSLKLRLLNLDDGKVLCEGLAHVTPTKDSTYEEDRELSNAVMRPFCAQLPKNACEGLSPEPSEEEGVSDAKPVTAATRGLINLPSGGVKFEPMPKSKPSAPAPAPSGTLNRDTILATVRGATARTRACYESALRKSPKLQGTLSVSFTVAADGHVAAVQSSGFPDENVTACVSKVFQTLRFAKPGDGKATTVKYPITFKPG